MTFHDIQFLLESNISGMSVYADITDRILDISKIHEVGERDPGEYLLSQVDIKLNDFDGWYDSIFLNYFYDDRLASGKGDTILNIWVDSALLWIGYLKTPSMPDRARRLAEFTFNHILDKSLETRIPYDTGDGSTNWISDSHSQGILVDGLDLIATDNTSGWYWTAEDKVTFDVENVDIISIARDGESGGYQGPHWEQSDYGTSGWNFALMLKNVLNVHRCWFAWNNAKWRLMDKNGTDKAPIAISEDIIIDHHRLAKPPRYNKITMDTASNPGVYQEFIGANDELTLDATYYEKEILSPYYDWVAAGLNNASAEMNYDYYKAQQPGDSIIVEGLSHFIGCTYTLPASISAFSKYVCKELYRDFVNKTTELIVVPVISTLPYAY